MQNDLKYSKISEICGINGYFAGKILKKIAPAAPKYFPLRGSKFTHIFKGEGGRIQLLVSPLLCASFLIWNVVLNLKYSENVVEHLLLLEIRFVWRKWTKFIQFRNIWIFCFVLFYNVFFGRRQLQLFFYLASDLHTFLHIYD